MMNTRKLLGALTLLLFVAPLGASFCGNCAPGHCMMTGASEMSEVVETPEPSEPEGKSPCHGPEAMTVEAPKTEAPEIEVPTGEKAPCHSSDSDSLALDCCSITTSPEPETTVVPAGPVVFEMVLEAALGSEIAVSVQARPENRPEQPPRQIPRPLYTLHSAFLI